MMRRTQLLIGSMALVGALWGALLLISGLGLQAAEAQTATTPSSGTVTAWGSNAQGQSTVPTAAQSGVTAIDAGSWHSLALKDDGTVVAWGSNASGQSSIPASLSGVTAISAGGSHSLALKNDGTVVAWGNNASGQSSVPAGLSGVTAISADGLHSLALGAADTTAPTLSVGHTPDSTNGWNKTSPVTVNVSASDSGSGLADAPTCTDGTTSLTLTAGSTAGSWTAPVLGDGTHNISCSVSDNATNPSGPKTDTVNIDTIAPSISDLGPTTQPNAASWYNTDVTNTFKATDSGSGLSAACLASFPLNAGGDNVQSKTTSGEGLTQKVTSDSCTDVAGNTATGINSATFQVDKTGPSTSCSLTPSKLSPASNNHKLLNITASVQITDTTGGSGANGFTLLSVTSNQAGSGLGTDDVPNDIQGWDIGTPDLTGQLRAERYGTDRTYTLTYRGKDLAGNTKDCLAMVKVVKGK